MSDKTTVNSPMPGVFYRRPDPEDPPFVEVGTPSRKARRSVSVEVMKNFHDIEADSAGTISEFLVDDEAEIEADQELVTIE